MSENVVSKRSGEFMSELKNPTCTFSGMHVGNGNRFAVIAVEAVVEEPGSVYHLPVHLW